MGNIIAIIVSIGLMGIPAADHDVIYDSYDGPVLTREVGTVVGPSGREAYYNLPMEGVVAIMRDHGYTEAEYPYWVRDDGCKMLGPFIMVAMDLEQHPRGSIVPTSRGLGIVADTGSFIYDGYYQLDMAVNW